MTTIGEAKPLSQLSSAQEDRIAIAGRALTTAGHGLRDARVELRPTASRSCFSAVQPVSVASTGADGRFVIHAPGSGMFTLCLFAPGYVPMEIRITPLIEALRLPRVTVERDVGLTLRVLDPDGRPAVGAWVSTMPLGKAVSRGGWRRTASLTQASADGTAHLPRADHERLEARAFRPDLAESSTQVVGSEPVVPEPVAPESPAQELRLKPAAPRRLRLLNAEHRPQPGAHLRLGEGGWMVAGDEHGNVDVAIPLAEALAMVAEAPDGSRAVATVTFDGPSAIVLTQPAKISGQVISEATGDPLPQAIVWFGTDIAGFARTDAEGRFCLRPPAGGELVLEAATAEFLPHLQRLPGVSLEPLLTEPLPPIALRPKVAPQDPISTEGRPVFGLVLDDAEQPLAGTSVKLRSATEPEPAVAQAVTDDEGIFQLQAVAPGTFSLVAYRQGFAALEVPGLTVPAGVEPWDIGTLLLAKGGALEGEVVARDGEPIEDALVRARAGEGFERSFPEPGIIETRTDAEGRFSLSDLQPGQRLDLEVTATGFATGFVKAVEAPVEEPLIVRLTPAAVLSGTVVTVDGQTIDGAVVEVASQGDGDRRALPSALTHAASDETGRFTVDGLAPGAARARASADGYPASEWQTVELVEGEEHGGLEIVLAAGAIVAGRVASERGDPLFEARVEAVLGTVGTSGAFEQPISRQLVLTDREGRFRLEGLRPGKWTLAASHQGYLPRAEQLEARSGFNTLDFALETGAEVSGQVVADDGSPAPGARVRLEHLGDRAPVVLGLGPGRPPEATSDLDGSFRLGGVEDGVYRLSAEKPGYASVVLPEPIEVRGASQAGFLLSLTEGATVVGRLVGLAFEELGRTEVVAVGTGGTAVKGTVDPQGHYRVDHLAAGEWTLAAVVTGSSRQARGSVSLVQDVEEAVLDLDFTAGLVLSGRVLVDGQSASGAVVRLQGLDIASGGLATTENGGAFRIENLEAGSYELLTEVPELGLEHRETLGLTGDHSMTIRLRSAAVAGRVIDAVGERPLAGAVVALERPAAALPERPGDRTTTDGAGHFRFVGLAGETYQLVVTLAGYETVRLPIEPSSGPSGGIEIALTPADGLDFVITDLGVGLPAVLDVVLLDASGAVVLVGSYPVGADGRGRISDAPQGHWSLVARIGNRVVPISPIDVPGQASLVFAEATGLRVVVPQLEASSTPAEVWLTSPGGLPLTLPLPGGSLRRAWPLLWGEALLAGLPPGSWSVEVRTGDGRAFRGRAHTVPNVLGEVVLD